MAQSAAHRTLHGAVQEFESWKCLILSCSPIPPHPDMQAPHSISPKNAPQKCGLSRCKVGSENGLGRVSRSKPKRARQQQIGDSVHLSPGAPSVIRHITSRPVHAQNCWGPTTLKPVTANETPANKPDVGVVAPRAHCARTVGSGQAPLACAPPTDLEQQEDSDDWQNWLRGAVHMAMGHVLPEHISAWSALVQGSAPLPFQFALGLVNHLKMHPPKQPIGP